MADLFYLTVFAEEDDAVIENSNIMTVPDHTETDNAIECLSISKLGAKAESSHPADRVVAATVLCDVLRVISGSDEDVSRVLEVLNVLSGDTEVAVRSVVIRELIPFASVLTDNHLSLHVVDYLLPVVVNYFTDLFPEVRQSAQSTLLDLIERGCINEKDIESQGCLIVENLCLITEKEDLHPDIVALMSKLLPLVSQDCQISLLCHFIIICITGGFTIRNACADNIGVFCDAYKGDIVQKFLFWELCTDDVWRVRKSCADNIMDVAKCCNHDERIDFLLPILLKLLCDDSPSVSKAAYSSLGPFISTFTGELRDGMLSVTNVTKESNGGADVLCSFTEDLNTVEQSYNSFNFWKIDPGDVEVDSADILKLIGQSNGCGEDAILLNVELVPPCSVPPILVINYLEMGRDMSLNLSTECAYSFPAVLLTLGKHNWPILRTLYIAMAVDMKLETRITLACSLHEVALILGSDVAASDLQLVFRHFIRDTDDVRMGVLKHLSKFLWVLEDKQRQDYLACLGILGVDNPCNWRFRLELCVQLGNLVDLYSIGDVMTWLLPASCEMMSDKVAAVRRQACVTVCRIFSRMSKETSGGEVLRVLQNLSAQMCYHGNYLHKQTYVHLCGLLVRSCCVTSEQFSGTILPQLVTMAHNKVANVRLVVAQALINILNTSAYQERKCDTELVQGILTRLSADPDPDVQFFACHAM